MLQEITLQDGHFLLEGYPDGSTVHCLATAQGQELVRLATFAGELIRIVEWLELLERVPEPTREATFVAALVRFCGCFEGSVGHRQRPLKPKHVYEPEDRKKFRRLKNMRNKMVAHDDQLYHSVFPLFVLDSEGLAIQCSAFSMQPSMHTMDEKEDLIRLAAIARDRVAEEFDKKATEITEFLNSLPLARRFRIKQSPEFQIQINREDKH